MPIDTHVHIDAPEFDADRASSRAKPVRWRVSRALGVALSLNDQQATDRFGALDVKLPQRRFAKA
jgi:hypothetical protein